ncbi:unnamed protein product [Mycena citricolor]|uniref:Protein kinase domain-containing protein n=1 Tax=Mycena citricolor TaxID=2018698 RepID=A0AAD2Q6A4_9AGAR|nr:unnamed protein product [Mycena citricolor]
MEQCSPPSTSSSVSSSPRLSHLSTSTSTSLSSAFSGSELSSLPSPSVSPAPRESLSEIISPVGAKTHAFFASPFTTRPPSPPTHTPNASTSTITSPSIPIVIPPRSRSPPIGSYVPKKPRDYLWLDLNPKSVHDLSSAPSPISAYHPAEDTTPKPPHTVPAIHEELVPGCILRAKVPARSGSVSTHNSGFLTSGSSSPLPQSPLASITGLPDTPASHSVSFSGLPPGDSDVSPPLLTVDSPKEQETTLKLMEPLGTGAFSSVWLAEDLSEDPLVLRRRRSIRNLRREGSLPATRTSSLRRVRVSGVRPLGAGKQLFFQRERNGTLHTSPSNSALNSTRLVALKLTARTSCIQVNTRDEELQRDRTRVSFVREVEVLRHISHPNITKLLAHLTTPSYHVLVLPYISGGDLLGLVNNDYSHRLLGESLLRRMWSELCKAVEWMHGVGLVHRDVKLENVLLTAPFPFTGAPPSGPLIKLTDFGLSRFIDVDAPMLSTRCGSEAYAAPELVISGRKYDGRETDAWACGVVLYALCVRTLPFGEGALSPGPDAKIGREGGLRDSAGARRHWLMCIARGEWEWPRSELPRMKTTSSTDSDATVLPEASISDEPESYELMGPQLVESAGARRIVERLLVRDTTRRAKLSDLWNDDWMLGGLNGSTTQARAAETETTSPLSPTFSGSEAGSDEYSVDGFRGDYPELDEEQVEGFDDEDLEDEEDLHDYGLLLDQDSIDNIARQEVN